MSCLAIPMDGLPTRRIRRNCASVASGISEQSICESGICFALLAARLSLADDPDCFLLMLRPPDRIHHKEDFPHYRLPDSLTPPFLHRVLRVSSIQTISIAKDGRCFFKGNAVLFYILYIREGFSLVPGEHMAVYTEIGDLLQPGCNPPCPSRMALLVTLWRDSVVQAAFRV